jgi:hypothetical protein
MHVAMQALDSPLLCFKQTNLQESPHFTAVSAAPAIAATTHAESRSRSRIAVCSIVLVSYSKQ